MTWMVTGAAGMLGQDVVRVASERGRQVRAVTREDLDLRDERAVERAVSGCRVVVNCAAYTAVDAAETDEASAFLGNAVIAQNLARAAAGHGAVVVHFSTDYVFDGSASTPYREDAPLEPVSAYGRTKAAGEWAVKASNPRHLLLRTAWLYGANGRCFPRTIAGAAATREHLDVVADQVGQPTWTVDVADLAVRLLDAAAVPGTYHATSSGSVTWHGFAQRVVSSAGRDPAMVRPTTSEAFKAPAPRPAYSVLGHDALVAAGVTPIGDWAERWDQAAAEVLTG